MPTGVSFGGQMPGAAPPGMVWDPKRGGYVSITQGAVDKRRSAELTRPQYEVSPQGEVMGFDYGAGDQGAWTSRGYVPDMGGAATRASGTRAAAGGGDPNSALLGKIDELWNRGPITADPTPRYEAPTVPDMSPDLTRAERAMLTGARERGAMRHSSALRGLDDRMQTRGIQGSTIHGQGAAALEAQSLGDDAMAERELIGARSGRIRELENMAFAGGQHAGDQNFAGEQNFAARKMQAQIATEDRLRSLLSFYGMAY